jgi:hypothetical protein
MHLLFPTSSPQCNYAADLITYKQSIHETQKKEPIQSTNNHEKTAGDCKKIM